MSVKEVFRYMEAVESPTGPASTDARAIAMVVARRSHEGSVWLSREEIGDAVLLGSVATRRALRELVRAGWLVEEHKPGRSRWSLAFPEQRPDTLAAARDRRHRTPSRPLNGSKAGDQRLEGFGGERGSTARRLGDQRLEGLVINGSKATPPGSPPKTPTADPPSGSDPGSSKKQIHPESGSPREVTRGQVALPGLAEVVKPTDPLQAPEVVEVLEHWRSRGYHTRPVADTPDRRKRIRARLDEGSDVATLKAAIDGASIDDWLMGRAQGNNVAEGGKVYKDLETILRDARQVEKLATLWDVALAEGRVHEDGGDPTHDRFGNPRPRAPKPTAEELAAAESQRQANIQRLADFQYQLGAEKRQREAAKLEAERQRGAALTPEQRIEEDMLRAAADRGKARLAQAQSCAGDLH